MRRLLGGVGLAGILVIAQTVQAADDAPSGPSWLESLKGAARGTATPRATSSSAAEASGSRTSSRNPPRTDSTPSPKRGTASQTPVPLGRRGTNGTGRTTPVRPAHAPGFTLSDDSPDTPSGKTSEGEPVAVARSRGRQSTQATKLRALAELHGTAPATSAPASTESEHDAEATSPPGRDRAEVVGTGLKESDQPKPKTSTTNARLKAKDDDSSVEEPEAAGEPPVAKASWSQVFRGLFSAPR